MTFHNAQSLDRRSRQAGSIRSSVLTSSDEQLWDDGTVCVETVCLLSVQPMLTVAAAAVPAGGAAPEGAWGAATEDPAVAAATAAVEALGWGACWSLRARWPSLTIWMMASASASS